MLEQMYNFYSKSWVWPPGYTINLRLTMRLIVGLLLSAILQVNASTFAQKVTLVEKNTPLNKVFEKISNQTGFDFLVSTENLKRSNPVTVDIRNEDMKPALDKIFNGQPLNFVIQEKIVVISAKESVGRARTEGIQKNPISGKIIDEQGNPLPGATIRIPGTAIVVTADTRGMFTIADAPPNGSLSVAFIGYTTIEVAYSLTHSLPPTITLSASKEGLNEIQIIGYGKTSKRLNTGSVSTLNATEIENQPVSNPLAALQGRAPGVLVQTQNGLPGGNIKVQIRGQGSITAGTDPLFIVDGVPFLSASISGSVAASGMNGPVSPLSILNPSDIESMSILKDADATAIYGSRGANGVVLITTKKGVAGKDKFSIDYMNGSTTIGRINPYLNLKDYLQLRREAFKNDNITPTISNAPDLMVWDTTKYTDWEKYFFGGSSHLNRLQMSISGGDAGTRYIASLNYREEGTILPGDERYKKGGGYLNIEHTGSDKRLSTSFSINYSLDDNHTLYQGFNTGVGIVPPDFPVYNTDGSFNWDSSNPVAGLGQKQSSTSVYLNSSAGIKYNLSGNLSAKINLGYNTYELNQVAIIPQNSQNPAFSPQPVAFFATNSSKRYIMEPQLDYSKTIGDGKLTALLGGTYQYAINEGTSMEGDGVTNPDLLGNLGAANTISAKTNTYGQYRYASIFARLNYVLKNEYLLDLNVRRDGSSRFGPGKQYGNFYAAGAGWIFSQEALFKEHLSWLSYGKLRGSYGLTGNDQIPDYQYLSTYASGTTYAGLASLSPARVANPDYGWETTKKLEFALELGFLKDRLLLTSALYRNTSSNQLIAYALPYIAGFASYQANFPAVVQNQGLELELNGQIFKGKKFNWNTSFNITFPQNKLVSFPNIAASSYANTYIVGEDLSLYKSFPLTGIDPQTGLAQFKDQNGDGVISFPYDVVVQGKTSPDWFGGFSNSFSFSGLQLDILFDFVKRKYPGTTPSLGSIAANDPAFVLDRWKKPGDITDLPRATAVASNLSNYNGAVFSDASYARLKNLAVSWTVKPDALQKLKIAGLKLYVQGENLVVFANNKRFDPEISGGGIPPLKTLTAGLKLNF